MKIYLADTKQREYLGHNKTIPYFHHLESYYAIMQSNTNITKWSIFSERNNAKKSIHPFPQEHIKERRGRNDR